MHVGKFTEKYVYVLYIKKNIYIYTHTQTHLCLYIAYNVNSIYFIYIPSIKDEYQNHTNYIYIFHHY